MKSSSMFTAAAVLAAMTIAAPASAAVPAAAVYTMTGSVVSQKLTVSGCKAVTFGGVADATFFADYTYSVVRTGAGDTVPMQTGTYYVQSGTSTYSVYMSPDDASRTALLGNYTGADTSAFYPDVVGALSALAQANCQLKYSSATMTVLAPTVLTSKNVMTVKNSDKSATLTYVMKGKQENNFKGAKKVGSFGATITMKGTVVETPVVN
jgi:hypothetical protein